MGANGGRQTRSETTMTPGDGATGCSQDRKAGDKEGVSEDCEDASAKREVKISRSGCFRSVSVRWACRISDWDPGRGDFGAALALLDEAEAKRVCRFRFFNDAKRSLLVCMHVAYIV